MIVTAHQPNYLPGLSVVEKIERADAVIWLTEVRYSRGGWTNRNRMPDGSWLTVPVDHATTDGPIGSVEISLHGDWQRVHVRTLRQHYSDVEAICAEIERPRRLLAHLNFACLDLLLDDTPPWYYQDDIDSGGGPISARLARMVESIGGTTYLSGPGGRRYLDEAPFAERGIAVDYFERAAADNPCALARVLC